MSLPDLQILARNFGKANPPPILHRYRRASEWTIKELAEPEIHITGVDDMNDPFEYRAPLTVDLEKLRTGFKSYAQTQLRMDASTAKQEAQAIGEIELNYIREKIEALRTASGLICATLDPRSNRMWAYYGDSHRGICVGYATEFSPFCFAREVAYADPTGPVDLLDTLNRDPSQLSDHVSCRKGADWAFEQEYRLPVGPIPENHTRLLPIPPEAIAEIRLGAKICPDFKEKIVNLGRGLAHKPRIIQMGCDHQTFSLTETIL